MNHRRTLWSLKTCHYHYNWPYFPTIDWFSILFEPLSKDKAVLPASSSKMVMIWPGWTPASSCPAWTRASLSWKTTIDAWTKTGFSLKKTKSECCAGKPNLLVSKEMARRIRLGPFQTDPEFWRKTTLRRRRARCRYCQVQDKEHGLGKMTKSQYSVAMAEKNELLKRVLFGWAGRLDELCCAVLLFSNLLCVEKKASYDG